MKINIYTIHGSCNKINFCVEEKWAISWALWWCWESAFCDGSPADWGNWTQSQWPLSGSLASREWAGPAWNPRWSTIRTAIAWTTTQHLLATRRNLWQKEKKYFKDYIVHAESLTWNRAARDEEICTFRNFVTSFHRVSVSLSRASVLVLALACLNILF